MLKNLTLMLALLGCVTHAGQQYAGFEEARARVTDAGYVVFIYPEGWDKYGEKLCRKLIADEKMKQATGDAVMLLAPIYQNRNETTNARVKEIMGPLGYPHDMSDISYPAIVLYEKGGRQYGTVHGRDLLKASPAQAAELVKQRLEAKKQQDALLKQANAASDSAEKARLLLASARVAGLEWPGGLRDAMQKADPGDKHGYLAALNFHFGPQKDESVDSMLKRLDAVLENELYTVNQKQRACAAAIGHVRRSMGTMAGGPIITRYARAMQKLDPNSTLGLSAPVVMRDWVREYRYGMGWSPEVIPGSDAPVRMKDVPIKNAGTYKVTFKITTGRDALHVKSLRVMDGSTCVAEDTTARSVTWSETQQTCTLNVRKAVKKPELQIIFGNGAGNRSTWGDITISQ